MSKYFNTAVCVGAFACAFGVIASVIAGLEPVPAALIGGLVALVVPPAVAARNSGEQQLHFFRVRLTVANLAALTAGVKIGRLPSRAFIHSISMHKSVAWNATTDTIQLGSTNGAVDILAATSIQGAGFSALTAAAGLGMVVGATGEQDIWAKYAGTGGPPTTGDTTLVIAFIPDNDQ